MLSTSGFMQAAAYSAALFAGKPLLHFYAQSPWVTASGFSLLLQHGADINAKSLTGQICLQHLFMCVNQSRPPFDTIQFLDACQYLVRRGTDIDAVDDQGISVSVEAYAPNSGLRRKECMSSLGGDVWDRVLAGAGFDVAYFRTRHGIPRRARYHGQYSRRNFEAMWAGMTELCPYYHDVELPYHRFYSAKSLLGFRSLGASGERMSWWAVSKK